jgi:FkbM family methyltransferase
LKPAGLPCNIDHMEPPQKRDIAIGARRFKVVGDQYLKNAGARFEPDLVALISMLCEPDFHVLDVGANIGLMSLAFSGICPSGRIASIEPVPTTFMRLEKNLRSNGIRNVEAFNFALGTMTGKIRMEGHAEMSSGFFVADEYTVGEAHTSYEVEITRLEDCFDKLGLRDRLDFIKIDVEGHELDVLDGARNILDRFKPIVMLEMNHWCLNVFKRVSLPEFRERLLEIFPCVFAIDGTQYFDFSDDRTAHHIYYGQLVGGFKFSNLIAGFKKAEIIRQLSFFDRLNESRRERDDLALKIDQMTSSLSWKITKPLRAIKDRLG